MTEATGWTIGPGTELDGFVIEDVLGRGGMGVVYRARQRRPERVVALKVIAPALADDPSFRARFERESEIAAQIEHPNVIPVHAVGEVSGVLYIAMRLVDGRDLASLLAQLGRLEPQRAAAIVDQVAQALDAAHARGLVHRDVKPANILISASSGREHVYLSDFGLSRHVDGSQGLTGTGAFVGTIDYVAPEQVQGHRVDARTDVYSLGCVLFRALTGQVPFPLDNDLAKLFAHGSHPPPSATDCAPELPAAFDGVLTRAMAKDPDDRFPSAGDLGRAALAAAAGAPVARVERSVAIGPAAPAGEGAPAATTAVAGASGASAARRPGAPAPLKAPRTLRWPQRRLTVIAVATAILALAAVVVVLITAGGSSHPPSAGTGSSSLGAVQAQAIAPIHDEDIKLTKQLTVRQGYTYRLTLSTVKVPAGASARTAVPYYLTLSARQGSRPFVGVQRTKLPWQFTTSSIISQFQLDPDPDGSVNVGLSWFLRSGDTNDQTHYFTLTPQSINIDG